MIIMDPKKTAMSIVKRRKDALGNNIGFETHRQEEVKDTDGELDPKHMAAEEIMMAIHSKSASKLREALSNFHDLHSIDRASGSHNAPDDAESDFLA